MRGGFRTRDPVGTELFNSEADITLLTLPVLTIRESGSMEIADLPKGRLWYQPHLAASPGSPTYVVTCTAVGTTLSWTVTPSPASIDITLILGLY